MLKNSIQLPFAAYSVGFVEKYENAEEECNFGNEWFKFV